MVTSSSCLTTLTSCFSEDGGGARGSSGDGRSGDFGNGSCEIFGDGRFPAEADRVGRETGETPNVLFVTFFFVTLDVTTTTGGYAVWPPGTSMRRLVFPHRPW